MKLKTVNDMYNYTKTVSNRLLSDYSAEFWEEYKKEYQRYDALFRRMFYSFRYYMQEEDESIANVASNFSEDVYNHLMMNDKKYSELYRIHVIADDNYSITDNYNVTEKMSKDTSKDSSDTYGERTDITADELGEKTETTNTTIGSKTDTNVLNTGSQTTTGTNTIAGFNSSDFENDKKLTQNVGERTDNTTIVSGEQNNKATVVSGSQNNKSTFQKSTQTDTHTGTGKEEYTLTRVGNIGTKTVTAVMEEHTEFWSKWDFYSMIFKEICAELLLI